MQTTYRHGEWCIYLLFPETALCWQGSEARIQKPTFCTAKILGSTKIIYLAIYSKMTLSISILKICHIYNSLKSLFWEVDVPYFIQFLWLLSPFLQTCPQNYMPSRAPRLSLAEWNKKSISRLPCNTNNFLDKLFLCNATLWRISRYIPRDSY